MILKNIIRVVAIALITFGSVGFFLGPLVSFGIIDFDYEIPFDNGDDIVASSTGEIFIGSEYYHKIQKYDSDGEFIKNWSIEYNGPQVELKIINDTLFVNKLNTLYLFNTNGELISKKYVDNYSIDFGTYNHKATYFDHRKSITYEISEGFFSTVNVRTDTNTKILITQPTSLHLLKAPLPAWGFAFMGITLLLIFSNKFKSKIISELKY